MGDEVDSSGVRKIRTTRYDVTRPYMLVASVYWDGTQLTSRSVGAEYLVGMVLYPPTVDDEYMTVLVTGRVPEALQ